MGIVGLSVASAFPTLMSFAEHRMTITGKITGIFLAASNLSGMTMPWLIGQFFESRGPITLPLVMLAASVLALVSLAVLLKMGHKTMDKHKQPATSS
jgi:fucose permease